MILNEFVLVALPLLVIFAIKESYGSLVASKVVFTGKKGNFQMAQATCAAQGMIVVNIDNEADNELVYKLAKAKKVSRYWIDGNNLAGGKWVNSEKEHLSFYNWAPGEPNNWLGKEHCIELGFYGNNWWNDINCATKLEIICKNDNENSPILTNTELTASRVVITNKMGNFQAAQHVCKSQGMKVVRIENDADNELVFKLARANKVGRYWIDGNNLAGGKWTNCEKEPLNFYKWAPGEPNNWRGKEHCIEVGFYKNNLWNDIDCASILRIVCVKDKEEESAVAAPILTNPKLSASPSLGYELVKHSKRLNYADAVKYCKTVQMELVHVDSKEINKIVYNFAVKNNLGTYWIDINDIEVEADWVDSFGDPMAFKNWARGEPNGCRNENCVQGLFYKDALWNDISCDSLNAVICRRDL